MDIRQAKQALRKHMTDERNQMPPPLGKEYSAIICQQIWDIIAERKTSVVHSYLTMGSEVNVLPLLQRVLEEQIKVVVPKTLKKRQLQNLVLTDLRQMEPGIFGTYHPKKAAEYTGEYDLIIVAGLAFDPRGYRVGYGGGYYDTFLANQPNAFKLGVCFPFQMLDKVPVEAHDIRLDRVICP